MPNCRSVSSMTRRTPLCLSLAGLSGRSVFIFCCPQNGRVPASKLCYLLLKLYYLTISVHTWWSGLLVAWVSHPAMTAGTKFNWIFCVTGQRDGQGRTALVRKASFTLQGREDSFRVPRVVAEFGVPGTQRTASKRCRFLISFRSISVGWVALHRSQDLVSQCFRRLNNEYCSAGTAFNVL